jgi:AAA domain
VLYIDVENGLKGSRKMRDVLVRHLDLSRPPDNFHTYHGPSDLEELTKKVEFDRPSLVIIDTLRSFAPDAEDTNKAAGQFINTLRKLCKKYSTTFIFIHHLKKPDERPGAKIPSLESTPVISWLSQACGARGLVNHTDCRIAIEQKNNRLLVRAYIRVEGDVGPFHFGRKFNEERQAVGYYRLTGVQFLENPHQQKTFEGLENSFTFKDAMTAYGRQDQATDDFLKKCLSYGLLEKLDKGRYTKAGRAAVESVSNE